MFKRAVSGFGDRKVSHAAYGFPIRWQTLYAYLFLGLWTINAGIRNWTGELWSSVPPIISLMPPACDFEWLHLSVPLPLTPPLTLIPGVNTAKIQYHQQSLRSRVYPCVPCIEAPSAHKSYTREAERVCASAKIK